METKKKKTLLITLCILSAANILCFALYYLSAFITSNAAIQYTYFYFAEIAATVLPMVTAAAMLIAYAKRGINKAILYALPCVLTRILYLFPYCAFEYAYEGYEITSTLLFALLETFLTLIAIYIESTVLFLLMIFVTKIIAKAKGFERYNFKEALSEKEFFDFEKPLTAGIFSAACAVFVYNLALEIYDTVNFLISYSGTYRTSEIFYILFRYVFILAMLLISHLTAYLTKTLLS